jgi:hypothetical protein
MPLNKLDNFIKNTEGRILYVSPSDLDSTDTIDNQGNSLARPFKTLQRALIESARFSYVKGNSNDIIEKTTILLMPGEHTVDNRPGLAIYADGNEAKVRTKNDKGAGTLAKNTLNLDLNSNFDITQGDNILYKFNSVDGGVVVPRGTSVVGLDLRKTKIRPKYVPNPTDDTVPTSSIFKVTGSCYFWQFSIFDGNDLDLVYTDNNVFTSGKQAFPTFSHNKLTVFEYCDGVNNVDGYDSNDLDMYYYKVGNAYNEGSTRPIDNTQKYPLNLLAFEPQRPEWEIVGAFGKDPLRLSKIQAGTDAGATSVVTVTTTTPHNLQVGTPIKIRGVSSPTGYNISALVTYVSDTDDKVFTYTCPQAAREPANFGPGNVSSATVTIETDTVEGSSPYIFNCSMRSVWGMNGMKADGNNAAGFKSMVVAQFTGISLQKDDRAFVKYDAGTRTYQSNSYSAVDGSELSGGSSVTTVGKVYHLDSGAIYRPGWETTHIKITNDAILQIVSVFAIGYTKHFEAQSGGDASITNSNSNFGQLALISDGFKKEAFLRDDRAFITSIVSPRSIESVEEEVDWLSIDTSEVDTSKLYLASYNSEDIKPPFNAQGYKVGAALGDKLYVDISSTTYSAEILMPDGSSSEISYSVVTPPISTTNTFAIGSHNLTTGEKVIIVSSDGDLPENLSEDTVYYVITETTKNTLSANEVELASSESNAANGSEITVSGGTNLRIVSRVTDKSPGESGHPIQWDSVKSNWYLTVNSTGNTITGQLSALATAGVTQTDSSYVKRKDDTRSLDEKIYQIRVVIPKESSDAKNPENGFIIQESSSTGVTTDTDFTRTSLLTDSDYAFDRNPCFISTSFYDSTVGIASIRTDLPHTLDVGDTVIIKNVQDSANTVGAANSGYNGTFTISSVPNNMEFKYNTNSQTPGSSMTGITTIRSTELPRYQRNNLQKNLYIYRNEVVSEYIRGQQDGIYHIYTLSADNAIPETFTSLKYSQNVTDLYPQQDRDNPNDNPQAAASFAKRSPLGQVATNELKKSITRESTNIISTSLGIGITVSSVSTLSGGISTVTFSDRHNFSSLTTGSVGNAGTNYNAPGIYQNVKLYNDSGLTTWYGATARVEVTGGAVASATLIAQGSGYLGVTSGTLTLYYDTAAIGGGDGNATFVATGTQDYTSTVGNVLQFTGVGVATDSYTRITTTPSDTQVAIARTIGDPDIVATQYALSVAPSITVSSNTYDAPSGTSTFNCSVAHGLLAGNSFRVIDSSDNSLGDYIVKSKIDVDSFSAVTNANLAASKIYKHGFSANEKVSDSTNENLAVRSTPLFEEQYAYLTSIVSDNVIQVALPGSETGIIERFPYGSYIQVDDEIMRIASPTLTGGGSDNVTVIRGALGTLVQTHDANSLIKKIKPLPVEFRRPSILRASGHTFEYLGYGPGNYSTALPQVQDRTLTEREEFLSQSQEKGGGIVVYTGMNSKGDFYIGNLKKSSATGEETTYDTPIPTVTGQIPSVLSGLFDEVTIKKRLVVEGGEDNNFLSQFDGPVTFNNTVKFNSPGSQSSPLKITDATNATNTTSGALEVAGGVGIGLSMHIGGDINGTKARFSGIVTAANVSVASSVTAGTFYGDVSNATGFSYAGGNISTTFYDDVKCNFGDATTPDLSIYHNGSNSYIEDSGTGALIFKSNIHSFRNAADTAQLAQFNEGAAVVLYHNGTRKFSTEDYGVQIGDGVSDSSGELRVAGDITAFFSPSDENQKDNIVPIPNSLDKVISISGNTFTWKEGHPTQSGDDTGVVAQQVEALGLPGVVRTKDDGLKSVQYHKLVPLLIEAVKELSAKVDNLEQKLSDK